MSCLLINSKFKLLLRGNFLSCEHCLHLEALFCLANMLAIARDKEFFLKRVASNPKLI